MEETYQIFNAKLLLFGEYTVLTGSSSLAIPFSKYHFSFTNNGRDNFIGLIKSFYEYLITCDFDALGTCFLNQAFKTGFKEGLFFNSEIPIGFGLGSSGAFSAAVYSRFFDTKSILSLSELKNIFSEIEGFFHGKSSGIDPLIIYLDSAIYSSPTKKIQQIEFNNSSFDPYSLYLINSGIPRSTQIFVQLFNNKIKDNVFLEKDIKALTEINDEVIEYLLKGDKSHKLFDKFKRISEIQFAALPEMITPSLYPVWKACLSDSDQAIKLCGAGGGGFYYLLSNDIHAFKLKFPTLDLVHVFGPL